MIQKIIKKFRYEIYHRKHAKAAFQALKEVEKYQGKTKPALLKKVDDYVIEVFGSKKYAPWLYVYTALQAEFKEGWIPDNYYGEVVVPLLKGTYGRISQNNAFQYSIFKDDSFPDIFYYVNNLFISKDFEILSPAKVIDLIKSNGDKFVYKKDNSAQGKGVIMMEKVDLEQIKKYGNGVLQKYIRQASFFDEIIADSVSTLRLTTIIDKTGCVKVIGAYLRLGREKETHVKSYSAIKVPINISDGKLYDNGYTANWQLAKKHPDTDFVFANKIIPHFEKCIEKVSLLHKRIPFVRIIGWDVTIDINNEVQVMEWNGVHNDIKFSEATQGPIFKNIDFKNY